MVDESKADQGTTQPPTRAFAIRRDFLKTHRELEQASTIIDSAKKTVDALFHEALTGLTIHAVVRSRGKNIKMFHPCSTVSVANRLRDEWALQEFNSYLKSLSSLDGYHVEMSLNEKGGDVQSLSLDEYVQVYQKGTVPTFVRLCNKDMDMPFPPGQAFAHIVLVDKKWAHLHEEARRILDKGILDSFQVMSMHVENQGTQSLHDYQLAFDSLRAVGDGPFAS
jgi:hypothetical protein